MSNVTYYELSNYNNSRLVPHTFELDGKSYEEHLAEITDWLESLPLVDGYQCEEYIICDTEGVPSEYVGEWSISEEYFEYQEFLSKTHLDSEVVEAGVELGIPLDNIEDAYYGQYESDAELAEEYIASGCMGDIPEHLINYIDTERLGRDLSMDYSEHNGYYFDSNW